MFSIDTYNSLSSIQKGAGVFDDQLKSSGLTVRTLLDELEPLFSGGDNAGRYAIWILHRHFRLETGERMVAKGNITEPTTDISSLIVAERWNAKGEELEHRYVDDTDGVPPAPSPEFMSAFNAIMEAKKIDCLGVCVAPTTQEMEKLQKGYVFLETTNHHGRKHVLNLVPADDLRTNGKTTFKSCWTISGPGDYECSHTCQSPACPVKPVC
jgi:hypothetical protein